MLDSGPTSAVEAISFGALVCYQGEIPEYGKKIDIQKRLFETGHHTTFQHTYCSFVIDGIPVGSVTFGLHLHPFYNTGQRSGRFCSGMFANPDLDAIQESIATFWSLEKDVMAEVMDYVASGFAVYGTWFDRAKELTATYIQEDRPYASEKYVTANAEKIAQEQLRVFIPVIFPTALEYTINLSTLAALYASAWSPVLQDVTKQMAERVLEKWPELSFMFERGRRSLSHFFVSMDDDIYDKNAILFDPVLSVLHVDDVSESDMFIISETDMHPINLLPFYPTFMEFDVAELKTDVEMSVATLGQKQRHRTVRRSFPRFTGNFYLPPVPRGLGLERDATLLMEKWMSLRMKIHSDLFMNLAPYGAMVRYQEIASFNSAIHEGAKRLCLCAQEEIYHLARQEEAQISSTPLRKFFAPPCMATGKCGEGVRYCGRDLKKLPEDPFPKRRV
ncbi:MAG: hypothetical protein HGA48_00970 [Candidatus Yonathbacteria bacterium]|nr:hypothetical protein [Candidatus Yonathbacteria bacterium]